MSTISRLWRIAIKLWTPTPPPLSRSTAILPSSERWELLSLFLMLSLTKVGGGVGVSSITRAVLLSFVQETCLQTLAKGLLIYSVLLKHVEKEYRGSLNFSDAPSNIGTLIDLAGMVKGKVGLTRVFNYPPRKSQIWLCSSLLGFSYQ